MSTIERAIAITGRRRRRRMRWKRITNPIAVLGRRRARDPLLRQCGRGFARPPGNVSTRPHNSPGSRARHRLRAFSPAHTLLTLAAFTVVAIVAEHAAAQCAMCGQATGYAGTSPRQAYMTFLRAALVLLVPALGLLGGAALLLWRHRHADGSGHSPEDA